MFGLNLGGFWTGGGRTLPRYRWKSSGLHSSQDASDIAGIWVAFFSRCQRYRCRQDFFVGDDFHHNGAFYLPHAFRFLTNFGKDNPDPTRPVSPFGTFDYKTQDGYDWYLKAVTIAIKV